MKKTFVTIVVAMLVISSFAQKKILFDNTKSETAGNADWIIDDDQALPSPAQSAITQSTTEDYWQGALSSWGVEMVKRGYHVETLPVGGSITYNNTSNSQDLSHFDVFVVCEPNNPFTSSEKQAMINFVQNGGGLFIISDHAGADRDGDGWDALEVWNDFFSSYNNPFGFTLDAGSNISKDPATNVANLPSNTILHGAAGDVDGIAFYNGATISLDENANPNVVGLIFYDGYSNTGTTGVMAVCATYGNGRVVGVGDSSVPEDETAHDASVTYPGWSQPLDAGDATGDDGVFMTNATIWLAEAGNQTELLTNPYFTSGTDGWWAYGADITTNNGEVSFNITNPGVNAWDIQLGQGNLTLRQNYTYNLCWRATRENGQIEFNVGLGEAPYTQYFSDVATGFSGEWREHCISYTHTGEDVSGIALTANLGGNDANATFDYISLTEMLYNTVNVTFSVDMQNETVTNNEVYIVGSFNDWGAPLLMQPNGDIYSITLELETNKSIEFKYKNGTTAETITGACATSNGNRSFTVLENNVNLDIVCFNSCSNCGQNETYSVNAVASPPEGGTVTGSGSYEGGTTVTLEASPNAGYEFINWTEDSIQVSTNPTYSFVATQDINLVANFNIINGITNSINNSHIRVFPNPANHYINVINLPYHDNLKITIININGREIRQYMINNKSTITIDLSDLNNSIYFIRIIGDRINETFKIIYSNM